jgi:hypothetical protein
MEARVSPDLDSTGRNASPGSEACISIVLPPAGSITPEVLEAVTATVECPQCGGYGWTADADPRTGEPVNPEPCPCRIDENNKGRVSSPDRQTHIVFKARTVREVLSYGEWVEADEVLWGHSCTKRERTVPLSWPGGDEMGLPQESRSG